MVRLPADGREGPIPEWPLTEATGREAELWSQMWGMPQAVAWESHRLEWAVAFYVRNLAQAEQPKSPGHVRTLVRQLMDDLGLTEGGMSKNGWTVGVQDVEEDAPPRPSSKSRLTVVPDAAGA